MREIIAATLAATTGAAAMYYLDPTTGRRRRALVRDRAVGVSHDAGHYALAQGRRAADHLKGAAARGRSLLHRSPPTSDGKLHDRVRAQLGRVVTHPRAVEVDVEQGCVCLRGHVLANEIGALLDEVSSVPGVERVEHQLMVHEQPAGVPELQGRAGLERRKIRTPLIALLLGVPLCLALAAAVAQSSRQRRFLRWRPGRWTPARWMPARWTPAHWTLR
jgi:BON domain